MMNLNSSPSPFPIQEIGEDHNHHHQPNFPSSSSVSCNFFFNSTQNYHDQEDEDHYCFNGGSPSYEIKNKVENSGLKLTLWKKEDHRPVTAEQNVNSSSNNDNDNTVKWMSTKMRLMQKMKYNPDRVSPKIITSNNATIKQENDQSSSTEIEQLSSNNSSYNCNSPIRVCADCNTTKTPLWRSGPKGPKSLCNACGIRQRKARRAMAAAAAAANGTVVPTDQHPSLKIKFQHKEKTPKIGHALPLKKRCKTTATHAMAGTPSNEQKKTCFEDFFINLSKNLNFHRVFPEDERDAAILLMAISSGLVHG